MKTSECIIEIAKALCAAQNEMRPAIKDSTNPHFKSRYSDLSSIWESIRKPLTGNGITVWQDVTTSEKIVSVTTHVTHISGQWIEFGPLCIPILKQDAQAVGSAISYAKRYALCAAIGVVSDEDDDGEKAMGRDLKKDKPKHVDKDQWNEITEMINKCKPDYKKNMLDYLESQNITSYYQMDEKTYQKVKNGCLGNLNSKNEVIHAINQS